MADLRDTHMQKNMEHWRRLFNEVNLKEKEGNLDKDDEPYSIGTIRGENSDRSSR